MPLLDTITSLATGSYTVTRWAVGSFTDGIYAKGAPTTFAIRAVLEVATGMQRVVPGRDMLGEPEGQTVNDVRILYSKEELRTRQPDQEPDEVTIDGSQWLVFRVEWWNLGGQVHYRTVVTRKTAGAS